MLRIEARAKINWTLDILGRREDGYHLMDMLMQSVELADVLTFEASDTLRLLNAGAAALSATGLDETSSAPVPFDEHNLVFKAALALQKHTGCTNGATISLEKNIPSGAGMGGGSADAAAALLGLNQLWNLELSMDTLLSIGLALGADVPFMLTGGLARVGGIGEKIKSLSPVPDLWLVLTQPCDGLSTKEIFTAFDHPDRPPVARPDTEAAQQALLSGDHSLLATSMNNVLEGISIAKRPAIAAAAQALEAAGAIRGMMTGSGSVVYGIFTSEEAANKAQTLLASRYSPCIVTRTASRGFVL